MSHPNTVNYLENLECQFEEARFSDDRKSMRDIINFLLDHDFDAWADEFIQLLPLGMKHEWEAPEVVHQGDTHARV